MRKYSFIVCGSGAFPLDMLRYDVCWPRYTEDVNSIDGDDYPGKREVQLVSNCMPTKERWSSFGWPVVEKSVNPL